MLPDREAFILVPYRMRTQGCSLHGARDAAGHGASPGAGGISPCRGTRTRGKCMERWREKDFFFPRCHSPICWALLSPCPAEVVPACPAQLDMSHRWKLQQRQRCPAREGRHEFSLVFDRKRKTFSMTLGLQPFVQQKLH